MTDTDTGDAYIFVKKQIHPSTKSSSNPALEDGYWDLMFETKIIWQTNLLLSRGVVYCTNPNPTHATIGDNGSRYASVSRQGNNR